VPVAKREIIGDATESGLLRFVASKLTNVDKVNDEFPKIFEIPFNSDTKTHMSVNKKSHPNGPLTFFLKGAPERVLRQCSTILRNGEALELTEQHKDEFNQAYEAMAGKGHRVLAFAQLLLPGDVYTENTLFTKDMILKMNFKEAGLCFVGLVSLEDPPKHGVREAVGHLRQAGVKVVMVTGDHPLTAEAIGRKINLVLGDTKEKIAKRTGRDVMDIGENEASAVVIHGEQIPDLTEEDWDNIFRKDEIIFARTSPKNKLDIVKRAQALGHIVGVTGDGVNDSPALKKADLGIAMNNSGSDVSKEGMYYISKRNGHAGNEYLLNALAAAMILLDDNFASTVRGIVEGRLIFMNLKKSIQYAVSFSTFITSHETLSRLHVS
jgi:sodium/potassium-transporting ATPase subunit alpha